MRLCLCFLGAAVVLAACGGGESGRPPAADSGVTVEGSRVFPPGELEPGDEVVCMVGDRRIGAFVPEESQGVAGYGDGGDGAGGIRVETRSDGSVVVACGG